MFVDFNCNECDEMVTKEVEELGLVAYVCPSCGYTGYQDTQ